MGASIGETEAKIKVTGTHPTTRGSKSLGAVDEAAPILRAPRHSPDLPAPRRPRMARLTSRGMLCGPLPARGLPNTDDMATLKTATPVLGAAGLRAARPQSPSGPPVGVRLLEEGRGWGVAFTLQTPFNSSRALLRAPCWCHFCFRPQPAQPQ